MREIKFRALDKVSKVMYDLWGFDAMPEHPGFDLPDGVVHINSHGNIEQDFTGYLDRRNVELMQYTGLKDKNGKEIYEGDVVIYSVFLGQPREERVIAVIKYVPCTFIFYSKGKGAFLNENTAKASEVIGNIYENPELLKETK